MWTTITFLLGTVAFVLYLIKLYSSRNSNYWSKKGVSPLNDDQSIFELFAGSKTPADLDPVYYKELGTQKFGGVFEFGSPLLFVKDLDLIKNIMVKDFDYFVDHRWFNPLFNGSLFSKGLFFLHGQEWKDVRTFLSPTFTSGKIRRMFHHFEESSQKLLQYVRKHHTEVDGAFNVIVPDLMGRFTVDVIGATVFGMATDVLSNADSVFYKLANRASDFNFKRLFKAGILMNLPKVGSFFNIESLDSDVSEFFTGILTKALRNRENFTEQREDFLQLLTEVKRSQLAEENQVQLNSDLNEPKRSKVHLTEELAVSQAFTFFIAGFDTTANLLGEAVYYLAAYPDIQERMFAEVEEIMEASNGKIPYESVNSLEYMEMFISEILRMYPPFSRLERECSKHYNIPGTDVIIPKGSIIVIPSEMIHYDAQYYPEPTKFNPERFNAENKTSRNPYSYLPFGVGPRICIGMRLGLIQAKIALSYVIHNFLIQPLPGKTPIPVKMWKNFGMNRVPSDLEVRFIPRN